MEKETPQINVDDQEIALIKRTFADNDRLLKAMRAIMLNIEPTREEKNMVRDTFQSPELLAIMWKRFHPTIKKDTDIGKVQDMWLGAEQMVFGQDKDTIYQSVRYKKQSIDMTQQALRLLEDPDGDPVDVSYDPDRYQMDDLGIQLLARNQYIRHIEHQLMFLKVIAGQKEETPEQAKKRLQQDSSQ